MINRDFPNHDVKENAKDFPKHELCRVIVQKQYPFDQNNCTSTQTIAPHFEQLHLTENKSNHGEWGKISSSYTTDATLYDRIIDIGLPAQDPKQNLFVMTPPETVLY